MVLIYPVVKLASSLSRKQNNKPYDLPKINKKPMIAVTFDDGTKTDLTVAYPYMTERGIKGTSYIVGSRIGERQGYLDWDDVRELANSDMWEVGDHSYNHLRMSKATEAEIRADMIATNNAFINNGLEIPKHFAYPFGDDSEMARNIISEYRDSQRITNYNITDVNDYDSFNIKSIKAITADTNDEEKLQFVKDSIDYAINNNGLLVIYLHEITPNVGDYEYQTARVYFEQIIDYIVSTGIESVTMSEMIDYINKINNHPL